MRHILAALSFICAISFGHAVQAETRIFIIANNPDGYGIEQCLASGAPCGAAAAAAYCRARDFKRAGFYRRVGRDEITGGVPHGAVACQGGACTEFVAIECAR